MPRVNSDVAALAGLMGLTSLVAWNRAVFDAWLTRFDLFTQVIPWYWYLGHRLRNGDIPGWNPYQLSGTPFAGHPLSGWMYLPAMAVFVLFPVLTGFKIYVAGHLLLAAVSTYVYARVLGLKTAAALTAAIAFAFGPFLEWTTYTSIQFAQFAVWIPLALLGIELACRPGTWRRRLLPWSIAALALSQMLAGWVGEGWIYAGLLLGSYIVYRGLSNARLGLVSWKESLLIVTGSVIGIFGGGAALGAAGVWPRISVDAETSLAGGYGQLGARGVLNPPWKAEYLLTQVVGMGHGYHFRAAGFGGAVTVLALLALVLSPRRFAVPYFAAWTVMALVLTLHTTALHQMFYLIPGYRDLHQHDPWRVIALTGIGPAMLSGAAVQALTERKRSRKLLPLIVMPCLLVAGIALVATPSGGVARWAPMLAGLAVTLVVVVLVLAPGRQRTVVWSRLSTGLVALLIAVLFLQPTGLELTGSWLGWPHDARWATRWNPDPARERALAAEVIQNDRGGAGAYLQDQLASNGRFRYFGYGGFAYPGGGRLSSTYMERRFDSDVQAILVDGRPLMLGLGDIQGYDPMQLRRYVDLVSAINGKGQNYHTAFVRDTGVASPLLDLLDVRYVLISSALPRDRADVAQLIQGGKEVFRDANVTVYERHSRQRPAWIVHDVRAVEPGDALPLIASGEVDPFRTALVEGDAPDIQPESDTTADRATITAYEPDRIDVKTRTSVPSFLVLSEVYEEGWRATVNGKAVPVVPVDHALRGVAIPAGTATVELNYDPRALRVGTDISLMAFLVFTLILLDAIWMHRRPRRGRHAARQVRAAGLSGAPLPETGTNVRVATSLRMKRRRGHRSKRSMASSVPRRRRIIDRAPRSRN